LSYGAESTAASHAKSILTTALKFKFADVIVNCSRILREHSANTGDEKNFEVYDTHVKKFANILEAEIRSEELYQRVIMNYLKPPSKNQDLEQKIDTYCDALVGLSEVYDSPVIVYNMYLVWAYRYQMLRDFSSMLEVCNKAEAYIEANPTYHRADKLAIFQLKKMSAYLHLHDWKNGKINAEKCLKSFPKGSDTWFQFMEYYLLLAFHTNNYINALAIFNEAIGNSKFKKQSAEIREKWKIYDIYLNFIIESHGKENPVLETQRRKMFRLSRFLSDPILYPKDQRIFTVLMVIAQVLFCIEKKSFTSAEERIDRLKNYANRQLKKEQYHRVIQFIRLLMQLNKAEFQVSKLSNTQKYLDKLSERQFNYRGLNSELEVIPFERLWEIILSRLK